MKKLTGPNDGRRKLEGKIIDAEWEDVDDDPPSAGNSLKQRFKNAAMAIGVIIVVLVLIGFGNAQPSGSGAPAATAAPADSSPNPIARQDAFKPSELCSDEQVLEEMKNFRRKWLLALLTQMVADGTYIPPKDGNPIAEGVARATFSFPSGQEFSGYEETGGSISNDAFLVHCHGELVIRDAMKLPSGEWSPSYLSVPDAKFNVHAGKDGFTLEFPDANGDATSVIMHIAGATISLNKMRDVISSQ